MQRRRSEHFRRNMFQTAFFRKLLGAFERPFARSALLDALWYSHKPMRPIQNLGLLSRLLSPLYNAAANVLWSLLAFAPVGIFCYRFMERAWLWAFVGASLIAYI